MALIAPSYDQGPQLSAYSALSYLFNSATGVMRAGPLAMDVATLPKKEFMLTVIKDTVAIYAHSRMNHELTDMHVVRRGSE